MSTFLPQQEFLYKLYIDCNCLILYEYLQQPSFCVLLIGSFLHFQASVSKCAQIAARRNIQKNTRR